MEILFKSNDKVFFIEHDRLDDWSFIYRIDIDIDTTNIPHLENQPIIYHIYIDGTNYKHIPIYYEHKGSVICKYNSRFAIISTYDTIKDYTEVNIKKLVELL